MQDLRLSSFDATRTAEPIVLTGGSTRFWFAKRVFDVFVAGTLLVVLVLPITCLLFFLNPLFNQGSIFFQQPRSGLNLTPFRMWKFRTMSGTAESQRFAPDDHERITPLGRLLRHLHIDELPQCWNVLIGEMSMIGPRPEQRAFVDEYLRTIPNYWQRYLVRPGITGLAQVKQGYTHNVQGTRGKLRYDLIYARKAGFKTETYIVFITLLLLVKKLFGRL